MTREAVHKFVLGPLKRAGEQLWYARSRFPWLNFPVPCHLPYGGWFLAYGDEMGARVFGYRLSRHPYEEGPWKFLSRRLRQGMVFFDIGANQGFYTVLAAKRVGTEGKVYAFEPAPTERRKLETVLSINGCDNVKIEPIAIGNVEGTSEFHLCLGHQGSFSSVRKPASDVVARQVIITVPAATLDGYVERNQIWVDFFKMDVEGGELAVLQGAEKILERQRPTIMCEVEQRRTRQWGYEISSLRGFLQERGYECFTVSPVGDLIPVDRRSDPRGWNLVAAHPGARS